MTLCLQQRLALAAEGSAACRHIELLEDALRDIRDKLLLPSNVFHQRMTERINRLLAADGVTEITRRAG
jgi:hypothetical protein